MFLRTANPEENRSNYLCTVYNKKFYSIFSQNIKMHVNIGIWHFLKGQCHDIVWLKTFDLEPLLNRHWHASLALGEIRTRIRINSYKNSLLLLFRCAYVKYNHQEVYMCFCHGDLCNAAPPPRGGLAAAPVLLLLAPLLLRLSVHLRPPLSLLW